MIPTDAPGLIAWHNAKAIPGVADDALTRYRAARADLSRGPRGGPVVDAGGTQLLRWGAGGAGPGPGPGLETQDARKRRARVSLRYAWLLPLLWLVGGA